MQVLERLIGKPELISEAAGSHPKTAYAWQRQSKWREAGDIPSARLMRTLLDYAEANSIPLTAAHLVRGATVAEIDALLQAARGQAA